MDMPSAAAERGAVPSLREHRSELGISGRGPDALGVTSSIKRQRPAVANAMDAGALRRENRALKGENAVLKEQLEGLEKKIAIGRAVRRSAFMAADLKMTPAEFAAHVDILTRAFSRQSTIARAELRGITLAQLCRVHQFVEENCHAWRDTTTWDRVSVTSVNLYHVASWLIKPATSCDNCSFVELFAVGEQRPRWFCSHWWGEPIGDFIRCLFLHKQLRQMPCDRSTWCYWIGAYAHRHHSLSHETAAGASQTSLWQEAVQLADGVLLTLDSSATALARLWCACEGYVAVTSSQDVEGHQPQMLLDIATTDPEASSPELLTDGLTAAEQAVKDVGLANRLRMRRQASFPLAVLSKGLNPKLPDAQASEPSSQWPILNAFSGAVAKAGWEKALVEGKIRDFGFQHALRNNRAATSLCFDFSGLSLDDDDLRDLMQHLPPNITELHLRLRACTQICHPGLVMFGEALPTGLQHLRLDLSACSQLKNGGVAALVAKLPAGLQLLHMDFSECPQVGDGGVAALAVMLPVTLDHLWLSFRGCSRIGDSGVAALAAKLPASLQYLQLDFSECPEIGDSGVAALAVKLPDTVQHLHLKFDGSLRVRKTAAEALSGGAAALKAWAQEGRAKPAPAAEPAVAPRVVDPAPAESDTGVADPATEGMQSRRHEMTELAEQVPIESLPCLWLALGQCRLLRQLRLRFQRSGHELADSDIEALATRLPTSLQHMQLDFSDCLQISDQGVAALAANLPTGLERLQLNFTGSSHIGDGAVATLVDTLPTTLLHLQLIFTGCQEIGDAGVAAVGAKVPANLHHLWLSFSGCSRIGDSGVAALVEKLPATLQHLHLDLSECPLIGDGGVASLAVTLPSDLRYLRLDFSECTQVGDSGVAALAARLPAQLQHLQLDFRFCCWIRDGGVTALAAKLPASLEHLQLNFHVCSQIGDSGVAALGQKLPTGLQHLQLDFHVCAQIGDGGVAALAAKLPTNLRSLRLDFGYCKQIGDGGVAALAGVKLRASLQHLELNFTGCLEIGDGGVAAVAAKLRGGLHHLHLNFSECSQIGDSGLAALAAKLPNLRHLLLNFTGCSEIGNDGVASLGAKLPDGVQDLQLKFGGCPRVGDDAARMLLRGGAALKAWAQQHSMAAPARPALPTAVPAQSTSAAKPAVVASIRESTSGAGNCKQMKPALLKSRTR